MRKKCSAMLLAVVMAISLLSGAAMASASLAAGSCGAGVNWSYSNGVLTISGAGPMYDYDSLEYAPWYNYREVIHAVVIGDGVTAIGGAAFRDCTELTGITIPGSVSAIESWAFRDCAKLSRITLPNSVTAIGAYAFAGTPWLESLGEFAVVNGILLAYQGSGADVIIPGGVTTIGCFALTDIPGLVSVTIPDGVTAIQEMAFYGCDNLAKVTIPGSVTSIGPAAFDFCPSLTDIYYSGARSRWEQISGLGFANIPADTAIHCTGAETGSETDNVHAITTNLKDEEVLRMPKTAFTMRAWDSVGPNEAGKYILTKSDTYDNFAPDSCYELPLGVVLTISAYEYDGFSCDGIRFYAWSDPDGDGVYDPWLITEYGKNIISPSEAGPIEVSIYSSLFCIPRRYEGRYAQLIPSDGGTWSIPATVQITADYLTERFGANTLLKIDVATEYNEAEQRVKYSSFYLLLTGKQVDPGLLAETAAPEKPEITFSDVHGEWYADAVAWAAANGITMGNDDGTFGPANDCTRAQIVTFLWRAYGKPEPVMTENPFTDVDPGEYYYKAVLWAYENNITKGDTDTTFDPDGACTRAQAVTFQYRAAKEPPVSGGRSFSDVPEGEYYTAAVSWAAANGITVGNDDGTFGPDSDCTRAQIVAFLHRQFVPKA